MMVQGGSTWLGALRIGCPPPKARRPYGLFGELGHSLLESRADRIGNLREDRDQGYGDEKDEQGIFHHVLPLFIAQRAQHIDNAKIEEFYHVLFLLGQRPCL